MPRSRSSKGNKPTFDPAIAGAPLRQERERRGRTQRELADLAGVFQKTVANIELAIGDANLKNIEAVVLALNIDLVEIIRLSPRSAA